MRAASTGMTAWYAAALAGALVSVAATLAAVRLVPAWPEMGSRYDAPGAPAPARSDAAVEPDRDLWHALDEGRDPTDTERG